MATLTSNTKYVTVTIGGNDVGFASVMKTCALSMTNTCLTATKRAESKIGALSSSLVGAYGAIRAKAPNAKVVVVGYPRLFDGSSCASSLGFSATERASLNTEADKLNDTIKSQATRFGFTYADAEPDFAPHGICSASKAWVNSYSVPILESFHPNSAGQAGYSSVVGRSFGLPAAGTTL